MQSSTPTTPNNIPRRRPLDSQKGVGSDMSMTYFVQCQIPTRFSYPEQHQIKGLNAETVAAILFPIPSWLTELEYSALRSDSENVLSIFSLNMPIYNQSINPSEWDDMWFLMSGIVHPYALTWEVETPDSSDSSNNMQDYTIPALIVRDQNYQP
jgi:hypothetical protein